MSKLLSPAGSMQALDAAISAGADEVYLGGSILNARIGAKNFDNDGLISAAEKCRKNGVALCYTLNTLVSDRDFDAALAHVDFLQTQVKPYAYIVQDLGLAAEIKKRHPEIILHASTQCAQHSAAGLKPLADIGFSRIVMAREATIADIKDLALTGIETEVFIHGALCVSQSGGCLMSSFIGKRSGNRGECAQPCRLDYGTKMRYPLSLKDNCAAYVLPELLDIGVTSLKIEGRMKSPDYVYTVTSIYRRLIDEHRAATEKEMQILYEAFSRNGFTDAYFRGNLTVDMFGYRDNDYKNSFLPRTDKKHLRNINVSHETICDLPTRDSSKCLSAKEQRGYVLKFAKSNYMQYANLFADAARVDIPIWLINDLPDNVSNVSAALPRTIWHEDEQKVAELIEHVKTRGIKHITISNIAHLKYCNGFYVHGDMFLNLTNSKTADVYNAYNFSSAAISSEIMPRGLAFLPMAYEYCVFGRLPLMHTAVCLIKNTGKKCQTSGCSATLTDRTGAEFVLMREYGHRNVLYNSVRLDLTDKAKELRKCGVGLYTYYITDETPGEVSDAIANLKDAKPPKGSYTRGYYK